jgi:ribosomal protein S18 acetylase RimI-like enzyme
MKPAVELLAGAFEADPLFALLFGEQRPAALRDWFDVVTDVLGGCRSAIVRVGPESVAAWAGQTCLPCQERLAERLFCVVRRWSGAGAPALLTALADSRPQLPEPRWVLHWLAVAPNARGHGRGSAALREPIERAAAAGVALYTETANPTAGGFYRRAGFRQSHEHTVSAVPGLRYRGFIRDPGPLLIPSASEPNGQEDTDV